jgi:hypothetical protein
VTRRLLPMFAWCLLLAACGGKGGGDADFVAPGPLAIDLAPLPSGQVGFGYREAFVAHGGAPPYSWSLLPPHNLLPPGVTMDNAGRLSGTPTTKGSWTVTVGVMDLDATFVSESHVVSVGALDVSIAGLHEGEAWTGEAYAVSVAPPHPSCTFTVLAGGSGGSVPAQDAASATATYRVGSGASDDTLRVAGDDGVTSEFVVTVRPNPVGGMLARFHDTDVWWVRFDGKEDLSHAYASDFDAALVGMGLRNPASTSAAGTKADRLARLCVQRAILSHLNRYYLNLADGTMGASGLDISFPFFPPTPPHGTPAPGVAEAPSAGEYNTITVHAGMLADTGGWSISDATSNVAIENVTTASPTDQPLGVFVDYYVQPFNQAFANSTLTAAPIGDADLDRIDALLFEETEIDARATEIRRVVDALGKVLGAITAHEIGHALGLEHPVSLADPSLMNPVNVLLFNANTLFTFSGGEIASLRQALPGPGR